MSTKITVMKNGPLAVEGGITMVDFKGAEFGLAGKDKLFLCRCGHSAKKPFCDGHHKSGGFVDEGEAYDLAPANTALV